jgi:hypothetical protein
MPPEIQAYGERTMLSALQANPPDFILLTSRDVQEYGAPPFGQSSQYGKSILDWVRSAYRSLTIFPHIRNPAPHPFTIEVLQYLPP